MDHGPKYFTEVVRQVWVENEGARIEVGPDSDGLGCVELRVPDEKKSVEYFGKLSLVIDPKLARAVGKALLACADDVEAAEGK